MATVAYKCPCCGAGISFDSEQQKFVCEYCLSAFTEAEMAEQTPTDSAPEETLHTDETENEAYCGELRSYTCDNCGAAVFADENTVADFCYYCHNPIVCDGRLSGELQPNKIIPFAYGKDAAEQKFLAYVKKKWFVPNAFFAPKQVEKISGVYYPFWLTDADLAANSTADATRTRIWSTGKVTYEETDHFKLFRAGDIHFEDIATGALPGEKEMLEGILPFPSDALKEFSMPYLSGYLGKKRALEKEEITSEVQSRIRGYSAKLLRETMTGYDTVTQHGTATDIRTLGWEYALMPVWILTYQKKGKTYVYAMNGHTGKVYGELPVSGWKLLILFLLVSVGTALLATLIGGVIG